MTHVRTSLNPGIYYYVYVAVIHRDREVGEEKVKQRSRREGEDATRRSEESSVV